MFTVATSEVHADSVTTITGGNVYAIANESGSAYQEVSATAASLFNNPTTLTATSGSATTTADFIFTNSGFIQEATHGLGTVFSSYSYDDSRWVTFTVSETTTYELSGSVAINGLTRVYMLSDLRDVTNSMSPTILSSSFQLSDNTTNESLVVGGMGGDSSNQLTGSLTGSLLAGHTYQYRAYAIIQNTFTSHLAAPTTATSTLSLLIGDQTQPVPTPTAAMMGFTLLGGMFMKRKRRMA